MYIHTYLSLFTLFFFFFFFNDTATTEIYTLSLHDALPIFIVGRGSNQGQFQQLELARQLGRHLQAIEAAGIESKLCSNGRSEEHTSELQSQSNIVCRLLLEKKKKQNHIDHINNSTLHTLCN